MLHGNSDPAYTPKQKKGETDDSDGRKMKHNKECELIHIFEILCHTYHMKNRFAKADKYNSQLIKKKKKCLSGAGAVFPKLFCVDPLIKSDTLLQPKSQ